MRSDDEDRLVWEGGKNETLSVKSLYQAVKELGRS